MAGGNDFVVELPGIPGGARPAGVASVNDFVFELPSMPGGGIDGGLGAAGFGTGS